MSGYACGECYILPFHQLRVVVLNTFALSKGECIIFRGDFIHAGAAYKKENERVHLHLKPNLDVSN